MTESRGALFIILGAGLWGCCFPVGKFGGPSLHPLVLTWYIALWAGIAAMFLRGSSLKTLWRQTREHALDFLGVAFTGMIAGNALLYTALQRLDLTLCSVLERTQPLFVVGLAYIFLRERIGVHTALYSFLALFATILLVLKDPLSLTIGSVDFLGVIAILGTGLSWAASTIFGKRLVDSAINPRDISLIRFVLAAVLLLPILAITADHSEVTPSWNLIWVSITIAALGLIGFLFYYAGLRSVSASKSAFLELSQPLVGVIAGLTFFGEELSIHQLIAVPLLLFAGVMLATRR